MPEIELPDVKLPDFKLPESIDLSKIDLSKVDLSNLELPKQVSNRLPGRSRPNPLLPIAGIVAIGAAIAAIWWLFTSSLTGPRMRSAVGDIKQRMTGEDTDLIRYDNEQNLGSLLPDEPNGHVPMSEAMSASVQPVS